jgi:predicted DNA-binding helix-hairpin-helix protein
VYYSGYIPVQPDNRLPVLSKPPLVRENRLYQADWLMRFYGFGAEELVDDKHQNLDLEIDPKLSYAFRNPGLFPIDINKADLHMILRVPGIGVKSAKMILASRRHGLVRYEHLQKIGVVLRRAKYFISCPGNKLQSLSPLTDYFRSLSAYPKQNLQLDLFGTSA